MGDGGSDEPAAPTPAPKGKNEPKPNHYCLEPGHAAQLVHASRFFYADPAESGGEGTGAPICPVCSAGQPKPKRVSAASVGPDGDFPEGFRELAGRLQQEID